MYLVISIVVGVGKVGVNQATPTSLTPTSVLLKIYQNDTNINDYSVFISNLKK